MLYTNIKSPSLFDVQILQSSKLSKAVKEEYNNNLSVNYVHSFESVATEWCNLKCSLEFSGKDTPYATKRFTNEL